MCVILYREHHAVNGGRRVLHCSVKPDARRRQPDVEYAREPVEGVVHILDERDVVFVKPRPTIQAVGAFHDLAKVPGEVDRLHHHFRSGGSARRDDRGGADRYPERPRRFAALARRRGSHFRRVPARPLGARCFGSSLVVLSRLALLILDSVDGLAERRCCLSG